MRHHSGMLSLISHGDHHEMQVELISSRAKVIILCDHGDREFGNAILEASLALFPNLLSSSGFNIIQSSRAISSPVNPLYFKDWRASPCNALRPILKGLTGLVVVVLQPFWICSVNYLIILRMYLKYIFWKVVAWVFLQGRIDLGKPFFRWYLKNCCHQLTRSRESPWFACL